MVNFSADEYFLDIGYENLGFHSQLFFGNLATYNRHNKKMF